LQLNKRANKKNNLNHLEGSWTVAEIEISYKPIITDHTVISSSSQAYELIKQLWDKEKINLQEQFAALFFNQSKKIIGWKVLSTGNMTKCIVDLKLLVSLALHCMSTHVMIVHNHPSGNLKVSQPDESITATVKDVLKLIDVQLIDHLIIGENGYFSFNDEGLF
jgi:DNA repair protein RadC